MWDQRIVTLAHVLEQVSSGRRHVHRIAHALSRRPGVDNSHHPALDPVDELDPLRFRGSISMWHLRTAAPARLLLVRRAPWRYPPDRLRRDPQRLSVTWTPKRWRRWSARLRRAPARADFDDLLAVAADRDAVGSSESFLLQRRDEADTFFLVAPVLAARPQHHHRRGSSRAFSISTPRASSAARVPWLGDGTNVARPASRWRARRRTRIAEPITPWRARHLRHVALRAPACPVRRTAG